VQLQVGGGYGSKPADTCFFLVLSLVLQRLSLRSLKTLIMPSTRR
jgi:hypothetical protein